MSSELKSPNKIIVVLLILTLATAAALRFKEAAHPLSERLVSLDDDTRGLAYFAMRKTSPAERAHLLPALLPSLHAEDARVRRFALYALRKFMKPSPQIAAVFIEALKDTDRAAAGEAAIALAGCGKEALPPLVAVVEGSDARLRGLALGILKNKGEESVPALVGLLANDAAPVRKAAALTLGDVGAGAKSAAPSLAAALSDKDFDARCAAAVALNKIDPADRRTLGIHREAVIKRTWTEGRYENLNALERLGAAAKEAEPDVARVMREAPDVVEGASPEGSPAARRGSTKASPRGAAARALAAIQNRPSSTESLLADLHSPDPARRYEAAYFLSEMRPPPASAVPNFIETLSDRDPAVAARAGCALARLGLKTIGAFSSDAVAALIASLGRIREENAPGYSVMVGSALGEAGPVVIVPTMDAFAKKRLTLSRCDDIFTHLNEESISTLLPYVGNVDDGVRLLAALALGRLGSSDEGVFTTLTRALKNKDPLLRERAAAALGRIGTPEALAALASVQTK